MLRRAGAFSPELAAQQPAPVIPLAERIDTSRITLVARGERDRVARMSTDPQLAVMQGELQQIDAIWAGLIEACSDGVDAVVGYIKRYGKTAIRLGTEVRAACESPVMQGKELRDCAEKVFDIPAPKPRRAFDLGAVAPVDQEELFAA